MFIQWCNRTFVWQRTSTWLLILRTTLPMDLQLERRFLQVIQRASCHQ
ncbi:hypothetical protein BIW11_04639 [Tropilaelaps mercedesae]|uniref:Uncharacterized protein n=1 Tax=Tropilaelaps mercedesae TaxID=418985 RepID=A0A1V9X3A1_9ACAR|nr:hypothetical protein BIW11_04639 [Tropilaelaps mercedesae]